MSCACAGTASAAARRAIRIRMTAPLPGPSLRGAASRRSDRLADLPFALRPVPRYRFVRHACAAQDRFRELGELGARFGKAEETRGIVFPGHIRSEQQIEACLLVPEQNV